MALSSAEAGEPLAGDAEQQRGPSAPDSPETRGAVAATQATANEGGTADVSTEQQENVPLPRYFATNGDSYQTHSPTYHAVTTGQLVDPAAVQAAAIAQQQAMYTGFGSPYALNRPFPSQYGAGGSPAWYSSASVPSAAAPLYKIQPPSLPGPCYYDPYGMLNPAACIAPFPMAPGDEYTSTKLLSAKKQSRWCC